MTEFAAFVGYALTFLLMQNFVLSRGVGLTLGMSAARSYRYVLVFGLSITGMCVLCSIPAYGVSLLLQIMCSFGLLLEPFAFTLVVSALFLGLQYLCKARFSQLYARYSADLAHALLNTVVLSAVVLPFREKMDLLGFLVFGLETGLAFLAASLLLFEAKKRLAVARPPRAFRGFPVMLLYVGLLMLALYGFVGHQLPF